MKVIKILSVIILFGLLSCKKDVERSVVDYSDTIKEIIDTDPQFSLFRDLYRYSDSLSDYVEGSTVKASLVGPSLGTRYITAFIPNNDAFANSGITFIKSGNALNPNLLRVLSVKNTTNLTADDIRRFLLYCIYNNKIEANDLEPNTGFVMLGFTAGDSLFIKKSGTDLLLNGTAGINVNDVKERNNGILYSVNSLMTPPLLNSNFLSTIKTDTSLTLFVQAITRANNTAFNNSASVASIYSTLFAPTNDAFRSVGLNETTINQKTVAYLADLINYHLYRTRLFSTDFTNGSITMLNNQTVNVSTGSTVVITNAGQGISANLKTTNIVCARSVVHKIDKVLKY